MKFKHLRWWHTQFEELVTTQDDKSNGKKFGRGGATVAYEQEGNQLRYAIARCHDQDAFVKSYGRTKAAGRLQSTPNTQLFNGTPAEFHNHLLSQWRKGEL